MTNKLSIITINRNNAEGLQRTIDSVLSQTFSAFEYIVIDGASTDNSMPLLSDLLMLDNERMLKFGETVVKGITVKWLSEPDTGVYQAMNKGIKMATGDYLLFLNSGDFLVHDNVFKTVFLETKLADILCGGCNVSENGKVVWTSNPPEDVTFGTLYSVGLAHQSTFIKRYLFEKLGMYREDFKYNSDIDFWYRSIIVNGASTEKVDVIIADYNLDGISSKEHQTEKYQSEINKILSQANFDKFLPDYKRWNDEKKSMEALYWLKSKKIIFILVEKLYRFAKRLKR
ncbi:MAG: glycosyltransferase family 2 protein [Paludibacter sp.]|nr:glycosyltransferase family 2 protein [Paludibacter sp.]